MRVARLLSEPIIFPHMDRRMGSNINGPSLIKVPSWIERPLGKYYLYFADHRGTYIRLAYADDLLGPWKTYEPGVLNLEESRCFDHIASPDVHVLDYRREIRMYYHGVVEGRSIKDGIQKTRVAVSRDGIHFRALKEVVANWYARVFVWDGWHYALTMPGTFFRSRDGMTDFERGPTLFSPNMRHSAVRLNGHELQVFFSNRGDCPETILVSAIDLRPDWRQWKETTPIPVLEPEMPFEGANLPLAPSVLGPAMHPVRELRDPAIFEENGRTFLLYAVAGEAGLALAEVHV